MNRYPVSTRVLIEAQAYARESLEHTFNYQGWEDGHKKLHRLIVGKACQLWLSEFCRLNNIPHEKDASSPYIADEQDMGINGWSVDSKASWAKGMWPQVSSNADNADIDFYFFFRTSERFDFIQPIGAISKNAFLKKCITVRHGEAIPKTTFIQRFEYSYFVSPNDLNPFEESLVWMSENRKSEAA